MGEVVYPGSDFDVMPQDLRIIGLAREAFESGGGSWEKLDRKQRLIAIRPFYEAWRQAQSFGRGQPDGAGVKL